ncbi:unnamed protein product, partial [Dicrocoelium dendriticum]
IADQFTVVSNVITRPTTHQTSETTGSSVVSNMTTRPTTHETSETTQSSGKHM